MRSRQMTCSMSVTVPSLVSSSRNAGSTPSISQLNRIFLSSSEYSVGMGAGGSSYRDTSSYLTAPQVRFDALLGSSIPSPLPVFAPEISDPESGHGLALA